MNLVALLLVSGALVFLGCENDFSFTDPLNLEICTDAVDNDGDGKTDCWDTECGDVCRPTLNWLPLIFNPGEDSLILMGTQEKATSISVGSVPSGSDGLARIQGYAWSFTVKGLALGTVSLQAIAIDSTGLWRDTVSADFTVQGP